MRFPIIDGFRGFFLLFMMIIHVNGEVDTILGRLNHHYLGWVEDAQGFVFISGLVVGLVYGGLLLRKSYAVMRRAIWARIKTIYSHQAGLILIFLLAALAMLVLGHNPGFLRAYQMDPQMFTLTSLGLVGASAHMGILPMYIYFMAITPLVLRAFDRGHGITVLMLSALAWMFAQTGLLDVIQAAIIQIVPTEQPLRLGIFFNVFGWQVIFFSGLYAGFLLAQDRLDLGWLKTPACTRAALIGMVAIVGFAILDRIVYWELISQDFSDRFLAGANRQDFSPVHLINFAVDLFVMTWLIVAGPSCGLRGVERLGAALTWLFTRRALVFLGQHSLHVFSFHILWVYVLGIVYDSGQPPSELTGSLLILLSVALLYLPAWAHARSVAHDKRVRQAKKASTATASA